MTATVLLVRHAMHAEVGRVLSGRSEIALDAAGRAQAGALAAQLAGVELAAVYSSPRARAVETAAALGRGVAVVPGLDEIDFGGFTGRSFDALEDDADWRRWNAERDTARCPGGETMAEAADRGFAAVRAVALQGETVLCVTHCDVIRGVVARVLGLPFARMFAFDCDPASVTTLAIGDGWARVVALNLS